MKIIMLPKLENILSQGGFVVKFINSSPTTQDMNDKENIIETFTDLAPRYEEVVNAELNRFWGWSYTGFINELIQMMQVPENGRVLDLATGTAVLPITLISAGLTRSRLHGLDITMSMLARAKKKMVTRKIHDRVDLVCASAMEIPYASGSFDLVTCALATHHMDVPVLLSETRRVLREAGTLSIGDVGGSNLWKLPVIRFLLRIAAFIYFLVAENGQRAWAEAKAVTNVRSSEQWSDLLGASGFRDIKIAKLKSKHRWIPEPLVIQALKDHSGEST